MDISKKILSDPVNKWIFSFKSKEIFLVGGYLRDLLQGQISQDKDFVLKDNVEKIASNAAKKFKGTFITLRRGEVYRVVLKDKAVLDFSYLKLPINKDLRQRDFTINSIAWSPKTGIIDPFGGRENLKNHIIKAIRIKNLSDDPLRIIRAYRIAAELGFKIENNTKKHLKQHLNKLSIVSSERITDEFFKILSNDNAVKYLIDIHKQKILAKILAPWETKGKKILSKNIKSLVEFDSIIKTGEWNRKFFITKDNKSLVYKRTAEFLKEEMSQGLNRLGIIRLSLLLWNNSISHSRLRVSNIINKTVSDIHKGYREIITGSSEDVNKISQNKLYTIFNSSGNSVYETAIILSFIKGKNLKSVFKKADEFIKTKHKILLNGKDIQKILKLKTGTIIGKILSALKEQQFKGLIKTRANARKWLLLNYT